MASDTSDRRPTKNTTHPDGNETEDPDDGGFSTQAVLDFTVAGCWNFVDKNNNWQDQRWVAVYVWDDDVADDDLLWSGVADGNGCFESSAIERDEECCFKGRQDVYLEILPCTSAACVRTADGNIYGADNKPGQTVGALTLTMDFGEIGPSTEYHAWRVFQYAQNAWDYVRDEGLETTAGSTVNIKVPKYSYQCAWASAPACYNKATDTIYLNSGDGTDKDSDVTSHEYGHFVEDKEYGSYQIALPGTHSICGEYNEDLMWSEGWGNYFGATVDHYQAGTPGATGDRNYRSMSIEDGRCSGVYGQDNEWNVATTLWDLTDYDDDGLDLFDHSVAKMFDAFEDCNDETLWDFYNGGGSNANSPSCNWNQQTGYDECYFVTSAYQNNIPEFNVVPSVDLTSQSSSGWVKGNIGVNAYVVDPDCDPGVVQFRYSSDDSTCESGDPLIGSVSSGGPNYGYNFNTNTVSSGTLLYTCARATDALTGAYTSFDRSATWVKVDNTPPSTTASVSCSSAGNNGWCLTSGYTRTLTGSDAHSGISALYCYFNGGPTGCGTTSGSASQGTYSLSVTAYDVAGNSASKSTTLKVDTVNPTGYVSVPSSTSLTGAISVSYSASDSGSKLSSITIQESALGTSYASVCSYSPSGSSSSSGTCSRSFAATPLPGEYCYRAVITDLAGRSYTSSVDCTTRG